MKTSVYAGMVLTVVLAALAAACQQSGSVRSNSSTTAGNSDRIATSTAGNVNSISSNNGGTSDMTTSKMAEESEKIDLQFIDMMVQHHSDGIKMGQLAVAKAQNAEVKAFAQKMVQMQREDSQKLEDSRGKFFAGAPKSDHIPIKGREMTMTEMMRMSQEDIGKLEAAGGAEFDRTFLEVIAKHHQMAIDMATEEKNRGKQADIKSDAEKNITQQTKDLGEISELKKKVGNK